MNSWEDDQYCFACGDKNPIGMHLRFELEGEELQVKYRFPKELQGYRETVHGGMLTLLLDEVMVNLPWKKMKVAVVSAELRVKLRAPAKIGDEITARAWVVREKSKIMVIASVAKNSSGTVVAEAEATCFKVDPSKLI